MDTLTLEMVRPGSEPVLFQLFTAVRAEELGMQDWEPALRDQLIGIQFEAQRRGYREQYPHADERLILRDGAPIGWLIVDRSGPDLLGIDIALRAAERSRGIGSRVIQALQEETAAACRPMVLSVKRLNTRAFEPKTGTMNSRSDPSASW